MRDHSLDLRASDAPRKARLQLLGLLVVLAFVRGYHGTAFPVLARKAQGYFGISDTQLGFLLSCPVLGSFVGLALVQLLFGRTPVRRMILLALAGVIVSYLVLAAGFSFAVFAVGVGLLGVFLGVVGIASPVFTVELFPESPRRVLSLGTLAESVPGLVLPFVAEGLIRASAGAPGRFGPALHIPYLVVACLLAALLVGLRALSRGMGEVPVPKAPGGVRVILTDPVAWLLIAMAVLHGSSDIALYTWMPTLYAEAHSVRPVAPGTLLVLYSLAYVAGRLALAALPEGFGRRLLLVLPGLLGGGIMLVCAWSDSPWALPVGYPLAGLIWCLEYPVLVSELAVRYPRSFRALLTTTFMILPFAGAVLINLLGLVRQHTQAAAWAMTPAAAGFLVFGCLGLVFCALAGRPPSGPGRT